MKQSRATGMSHIFCIFETFMRHRVQFPARGVATHCNFSGDWKQKRSPGEHPIANSTTRLEGLEIVADHPQLLLQLHDLVGGGHARVVVGYLCRRHLHIHCCTQKIA